MKHHVIYVPGLGDHRARGQSAAVYLWRLYGMRTSVVRMNWREDMPFEVRLGKLLAAIDYLVNNGSTVSLVGVSAGASAVLNAYAARPNDISGVVLICGKVNNPESMHPSIFRRNPGFRDSLARLPATLANLNMSKRAKIMSIHPITDKSVPPRDTIIQGAVEKTVLSAGHVITIAREITIGAPSFIRFLKRQATSR